MANEAEKEAAGRAAAKLVRDGDVVGFGTGSTAYFAVLALGERVKAGLKIIGIPTSVQTADLARSVGIPLTTLDEHPEIDITIDGADEVDPQAEPDQRRWRRAAARESRRIGVQEDGRGRGLQQSCSRAGEISFAGRGHCVCADCGGEEDRRAGRIAQIAHEARRQALSSPTTAIRFSIAALERSPILRRWR